MLAALLFTVVDYPSGTSSRLTFSEPFPSPLSVELNHGYLSSLLLFPLCPLSLGGIYPNAFSKAYLTLFPVSV